MDKFYCPTCLKEIPKGSEGFCNVCEVLFETPPLHCDKHTHTCSQCGFDYCQNHIRQCDICSASVCVMSPDSGDYGLARLDPDKPIELPTDHDASSLDCAFLCKACKRVICKNHQDRCLPCGDIVCDECMEGKTSCGVCVPCKGCLGSLVKCRDCSRIYCYSCDIPHSSRAEDAPAQGFICPKCGSEHWVDAKADDMKRYRRNVDMPDWVKGSLEPPLPIKALMELTARRVALHEIQQNLFQRLKKVPRKLHAVARSLIRRLMTYEVLVDVSIMDKVRINVVYCLKPGVMPEDIDYDTDLAMGLLAEQLRIELSEMLDTEAELSSYKITTKKIMGRSPSLVIKLEADRPDFD